MYNTDMKEIFFLVEEDLEGGYNARALGASIFTQGDTIEELKENVKEATACHFGDAKPGIIRLHIVKEEILSYG